MRVFYSRRGYLTDKYVDTAINKNVRSIRIRPGTSKQEVDFEREDIGFTPEDGWGYVLGGIGSMKIMIEEDELGSVIRISVDKRSSGRGPIGVETKEDDETFEVVLSTVPQRNRRS